MASAMYRLPFENDGKWRVARTNWDDPSGDHHDGQQVYAYDLPHEIGGKVRAARGGVVISAYGKNTVNTDDLPDDDKRKSDPNFTGGNWVLIRHIDNTVAHYNHLNTNNVYVKEGQVVAQGQLIAHSGNTGASSGPHLHFQVDSFWNSDTDKGSSIPVFFEDRNHASFRPVKNQEIASDNAYLRVENWRRCVKCQGLFLGSAKLKCPKGGKHAADASKNLILQVNNGKAYFFKDDRYSRYDVAFDGVEPGFPARIAAFWPGLWSDDIDAAVVWNNGKAYFFKDDKYIRYDIAKDRADSGFPAKISQFWPGVWESDIDAAVLWNNGKAYFFKGDQYIRYDVAKDRADKGFPAKISKYWRGVWESDIDAVVMWNNGKAYFFKDDEYIRYDVAKDRADAGFPAKISEYWSGLEDDVRASVLWPDTGQHEWRLCGKCGGLFSGTHGKSRCPAGGAHAKGGSAEFTLVHDAAGAQGDHDWHLCALCAGVFHGDGSNSKCPASAKHQALGGAFVIANAVIEVAQAGWKQCQKCGWLFSTTAVKSACPAGGKHTATGADRLLMMNSQGAPGLHNWRRCTKCAGVFLGGSSKSACPAKGLHNAASGENYTVLEVVDANGQLFNPPGQHGWGNCAKCGALFLTTGMNTACPAKGKHVATGILTFSVQ